ncbi:hypothetical protein BT63DRAFT_476090 [Microthyrium microscopicum]|uniref:Uncharacterized protein n=1 Tax=Microthyrium microscopicum TaxID=703497 RepID=A0A6A6URP7_9PEZI|nr:hypothetical protein BT63DRAFT_476090 [Microthyrium microscopicum]
MLSPLSPGALNSKSPSPFSPADVDESIFDLSPRKMTPGRINTESTTAEEDAIHWDDEDTSSPFVTELALHEQNNSSPLYQMSSPAKMDIDLELDIPSSPSPRKTSKDSKSTLSVDIFEDDTASMPAPPSVIKSRALSPVKGMCSPTKMSSPTKQLVADCEIAVAQSSSMSSHRSSRSRSSIRSSRSSRNSTIHSTQSHESLHAETIHKTQTLQTTHETEAEEDLLIDQTDMTFMTAAPEQDREGDVDDTCFSTFSEVPNMDMTNFAQLGNRSPTKTMNSFNQTPRPNFQSARATPSTARTAITTTSTPRANTQSGGENDTTNLLLDFTEQFQAISNFTHRLRTASRQSMSPIKSGSQEPQLLSYLHSQRSPRKNPATPSSKQNLMSLLDFELPPAPTPRSLPSITIREMEQMKSGFASQISALTATLAGREAEVGALKRAVGDAERRVGEAVEEVREERQRRENLGREKDEWVRRGREFEEVLKRVKKEVLEGETERENVLKRAEEAEERVHDLERKVAEADERAARAERERVDASVFVSPSEVKEGVEMVTLVECQRRIDERVTSLSQELHAIYKKKHVTKVAGLKKGFEAKTKEKCAELVVKVEELERLCEELQAKLDGTLSGVIPAVLGGSGLDAEEREAELKKMEEQKAVIERQKAELAGREEELKTQRSEFDTVMAELEKERIEKGELVAAVDEMLTLQADMSVLNVGSEPAQSSAMEDILKKSVGMGIAPPRPTGLARPGFGFGNPRIGAPSGLAKPTAGKSKILSNIERMGGAGRSD